MKRALGELLDEYAIMVRRAYAPRFKLDSKDTDNLVAARAAIEEEVERMVQAAEKKRRKDEFESQRHIGSASDWDTGVGGAGR